MSDGPRLDAEIYLPNTADAPYPTVLIRSPYPSEDTLGPTEVYTEKRVRIPVTRK